MTKKPEIRDFDLNLIKVLDAVIGEGNATKASRRLKVTPAAVSLALQRLQHTYSEELFIRTREGLVPTNRAREIHSAYKQALDILASTLENPRLHEMKKELTIIGSDIHEQYYLSQVFEYEPFEHYLISYCSLTNSNGSEYKALLTSDKADLALTLGEIADAELGSAIIEQFRDYCVICSQRNPLADLQALTLYNFYSFPHAIYRTDLFTPMLSDSCALIHTDIPSLGRRRIGYRTDSINGLISMVENSSCIAVLPSRLARFFALEKHCRIGIIALPQELQPKPQNVYACWSAKNKQLEIIKEIVAMLQTLTSFRK